MDPYSWSWNAEALVAIPALTAAYVWSLRRFPAAPWRIACFGAAIVLLLAVTITPIETIALELPALGAPDPERRPRRVGAAARRARDPAGARGASRRGCRRCPRSLLWVVNYGVWHLPWIYDAALRNPHSLLHLEHALYFVTGVLLWWPVVHGTLAPGLKAAYVFAAFLLASPIGLVMALVPEPIYDFYAEGPGLWGLSPIRDQQIAGVSMAVAEAVVFFAAFAFFFVRFFAEQDAAT